LRLSVCGALPFFPFRPSVHVVEGPLLSFSSSPLPESRRETQKPFFSSFYIVGRAVPSPLATSAGRKRTSLFPPFPFCHDVTSKPRQQVDLFFSLHTLGFRLSLWIFFSGRNCDEIASFLFFPSLPLVAQENSRLGLFFFFSSR